MQDPNSDLESFIQKAIMPHKEQGTEGRNVKRFRTESFKGQGRARSPGVFTPPRTFHVQNWSNASSPSKSIASYSINDRTPLSQAHVHPLVTPQHNSNTRTRQQSRMCG